VGVPSQTKTLLAKTPEMPATTLRTISTLLWWTLWVLPPLSTAASFSWNFTSVPTQCRDLQVSIDGGQTPYQLMLVPEGQEPLPLVLRYTLFDRRATVRLTYEAGVHFVPVVGLIFV
jgi:hypothetical protein